MYRPICSPNIVGYDSHTQESAGNAGPLLCSFKSIQHKGKLKSNVPFPEFDVWLFQWNCRPLIKLFDSGVEN